MSFTHDEPPDTVYLPRMDPSSITPPLALPDLPAPEPAGARPALQPARQPARPSVPSSSPAQRLAFLISHLLAAPTEEEARHTVQDGLRALVRCRRVALRLLDDPPASPGAAHAPGVPVPREHAPDAGGSGYGTHLTGRNDAWLRIPILADQKVIGTLALEAGPGQRVFTPAARATAEIVAHVLAQRLAHLRLLALTPPPVMPVLDAATPAPVAPAPAAPNTSDRSDRSDRPDALRLAGVCELLAGAVLVADEAGRVVAASGAFRQIFGLSRDATAPGVPSAPLLERVRSELVPLDPPVPIGPASATRPRRYLQRAPVRRVLERRVRTILAPDGSSLGRAVTYRDITHDFDATERQQRFLAAVAHELRTPLTGITGYAQLLLRELDRTSGAEPAAHGESVARAAQATAHATARATMRERVVALAGQSARMTRLLRDMLDLTYLESGQLPLRLEPVEMVRLVAETIAALRMSATSHRITLQAPRALVLRGDGVRIEQIVRHLLENAIKFSPGGGAIRVTLSTRRGAGGGANEVAWCVLRLHDRGAGVPAGLEETIFTPFAQPETAATRWISGIGLGLPLSRALAWQHGGTLRALPGQRSGATFELCLPLAGPDHPANAPSLTEP